ncbi:trace amine-associated receptor 13c-like [Sphaeramia orbicularis]|uniref:trace amine-associated receptor 13c-like n=1 Tax=Sphaeramia orbicularis TaxID=375764 RepID=UPI0011800D6A|nr:trace amine-associated receptor 13c-like [Sphaeramia orbicularis]
METLGEAELCFPHLFNVSCKKIMRPHIENMFIYIVLSSIFLLTTVLNLLLIISIHHYKQLQTPTNLLLLSLAVSDFFVGLLMSFQIILIDGCWYLSDLMCTIYNVASYITTSASVGTMVLISIDRYVAICDPLHYSTKVNSKRVRRCVCLCWFVSALCHTLLMKDNLAEPGRYNSCIGECVVVVNYVAGLVDVVLTFLGPFTVIIFLYMRVFVVAVTQARAMRSHVTSVKVQGSLTVSVKKSELKAARTLGVVVLVFLICVCPYFFVVITGQDTLLSVSSAAVVLGLFNFNSCLNPVIYACFYPWFRKCLRLIFSLQILQPGSSQIKVL